MISMLVNVEEKCKAFKYKLKNNLAAFSFISLSAVYK